MTPDKWPLDQDSLDSKIKMLCRLMLLWVHHKLAWVCRHVMHAKWAAGHVQGNGNASLAKPHGNVGSELAQLTEGTSSAHAWQKLRQSSGKTSRKVH